MPLTVCFYEDEKCRQFFPLTLTRPVYTLRAGIVLLFQRAERYFRNAKVCLAAREQIAPFLSVTFNQYPVNIIKRGENDILFVNGRVRTFGDLPKAVPETRVSTIFTNRNEVVAVFLKAAAMEQLPSIATQKEYEHLVRKESAVITLLETTATMYHYCWEIMADIETEIHDDFEHLKPSFPRTPVTTIHKGAFLVNQSNVFLGQGVNILPGAVIDASEGPVYIGAKTKVEPHATIIGPCFIGPDSVVLAGRIAASSIGHTCRVGGEVEECIFHACVNKYHSGFMGHSYVGPWVNFGALTTNSDLKNNYSSIRLTLNGQTIDSGSIKVGSFIGDHTKFGIGTLLNTGINVGVCCNVFGGKLITDKEVPSFSWGNTQKWERHEFDKAIETAQKTAHRRGCALSDQEIAVLNAIFSNTLSDDGIMKFNAD
jgi:UDP-N-acetylglucosamine diphosphorylase/glucosamine-1-phosphate N-acetyltransferase